MSEMILTKIVPAHKKTLHVRWCRNDFMSFGDYKGARSKYGLSIQSTCFWCKHPFEDDEIMALASTEESGNKLFCQKCFNEMEASKVKP